MPTSLRDYILSYLKTLDPEQLLYGGASLHTEDAVEALLLDLADGKEIISGIPAIDPTAPRRDLPAAFARSIRPKEVDWSYSRLPGLVAVEIRWADASLSTTKPRLKRFPRGKVEAWYLRRIEDCTQKGIPSSRDDDIEAARNEFPGITDAQVREVRAKLAPAEWKRSGPKRKAHNSGD